jgi:hypothetical protein
MARHPKFVVSFSLHDAAPTDVICSDGFARLTGACGKATRPTKAQTPQAKKRRDSVPKSRIDDAEPADEWKWALIVLQTRNPIPDHRNLTGLTQ